MNVHPARITAALDAAQLYGPQVDIQLGGREPMVGEWEAGTRTPTDDQVRALADLTGVPLDWFLEPGPPKLVGIACMRGRAGRSLRIYEVPRSGGRAARMTLADELKTSCRILGQDQVDDFEALCALYGRRPFQLVADWVLERIQLERQDPPTMDYLLLMRSAREEHRAELRQDSNVIDLQTHRRAT